jgi:hypothetical protein
MWSFGALILLTAACGSSGPDLEPTETAIAESLATLDAAAQSFDELVRDITEEVDRNATTRAELEGRETALGELSGAATEISATQTHLASNAERQATQAANDFQGTQVALDSTAAQAQLDFQNTQAALNQNATAIALGFATPSSPSLLDSTTSLFDEVFADGLSSSSTWRFDDASDWEITDGGGLTAARNGSWLLTEQDDFLAYVVEASIEPVAASEGQYYLLLNLNEDSGAALQIIYDGERASAVGVYEASAPLIEPNMGLIGAELTAIHAEQIDLAASEAVFIRAEVSPERILVFINNDPALDAAFESPLGGGAIGVQLTEGAILRQIAAHSET